MTSKDFATGLAEKFKATFDRTTSLRVERHVGQAFPEGYTDLYADLWTDGLTPYRVEKAVCEFVEKHGVDPRKVGWSLHRGHLNVTYHSDPYKPLSERSLWKKRASRVNAG